MVNEQMRLSLPRPRVRLDEPAPRVRVRLEDAPVEPGKVPYGLPLTPWSRDFPPTSGYWMVTDHATGTMEELWWFSSVPTFWRMGNGKDLMHDEFRDKYAWRGLVSPHPDVYPCPPYRSDVLVTLAMNSGDTLRTTYVHMGSTQSLREIQARSQNGSVFIFKERRKL